MCTSGVMASVLLRILRPYTKCWKYSHDDSTNQDDFSSQAAEYIFFNL